MTAKSETTPPRRIVATIRIVWSLASFARDAASTQCIAKQNKIGTGFIPSHKGQ
jgi:hypothetical protein